MKALRMLSIIAILGLAITTTFAQEKPAAATTSPKYDFAAEIKVKGVVEEVKEFECPVSGGKGAHLFLKSGDETILVHLALSKFLKEYDFNFAKGDEITVFGSKVKLDNAETILARKIERGNENFTFRDNKGRPLW